jgi:hypothetical protein
MNDNERQFEDFIRQTKFDDTPDANHRGRLEQHLLAALAKQAPRQIKVRRTIMRSPITKLVAACAMIAIAAILVMYLDRATPSAYAIEQTIEANRGIKQLYFEYYAPADPYVAKECWVEFDESGQPKNVRTNLHKLWGDQLVVHVWKDGKTQTWRKEKNMLLCYEAESFTAKIFHLVNQRDPRKAVETLYERQKKGQVKIEIEEPANRSDPIIIRGTFLPGKYLLEKPNMPSFRDVLYVDRKTKLVTAIEVYELKDGEYEYRGVWEYSSYDEPFDADVFSLEDELPADVKRIDMMALDIGLEQRELTDEEVAAKVVRGFFEALIEKDYAKAVMFLGASYDPDERAELRKKLEHSNVIRIVSIDEPKTRANDRLRNCLHVPFAVEYKKDGKIIKSWHLPVGRVLGVLNRWAIMSKTPLP